MVFSLGNTPGPLGFSNVPAPSKTFLKVKVEVYNLASSTKHHSPNFMQLPPGHRTWSFIGHLNSPGSIQPGCHFWCAKLFKHTRAFTVLSGTHLLLGLASACMGKMPYLGAQRRNIIQPSQGSNLRSLTFKSHMLPLSHDAPHFLRVRYPSAHRGTPKPNMSGTTRNT